MIEQGVASISKYIVLATVYIETGLMAAGKAVTRGAKLLHSTVDGLLRALGLNAKCVAF